MKFTLSGNNLQVVREDYSDPLKYYGDTWGVGESCVLYHVQQQLNALGFDLIKKRMHKDGHLVADTQQYLRVRNDKSTAPHIYLSNDHYAITGLNDDWNKCNHLLLAVTFDVFEKQPDCRERMERLLVRGTVILPETTWFNCVRADGENVKLFIPRGERIPTPRIIAGQECFTRNRILYVKMNTE